MWIRVLVAVCVVGFAALGQECTQWPTLEGSQAVQGNVRWFGTDYHFYNAVPGATIKVVLTRTSLGDPDLFVSRASITTTPDWFDSEYYSNTGDDLDIVQFLVPESVYPVTCYVIAVFGFYPGSYTLTIVSSADSEAGHATNPPLVSEPTFPPECSGAYSLDASLQQTATFTVADGELKHWYFTITDYTNVKVELVHSAGDPDLFITKSTYSIYPDFWNAEYYSYGDVQTIDSVVVDPEYVPMCYAIGVYAWGDSTFYFRFTAVPEVDPPECDNAITEFSALSGTVAGLATNYYYFKALNTPTLLLELSLKSGDPDMYISKASRTAQPNRFNFDFHSVQNAFRNEVVFVPVPASTGPICYAVAVYGWSAATYELAFRNGTYDPDSINHFDDMPAECSGDRSLQGNVVTTTEAVERNAFNYWYYKVDSKSFNHIKIKLVTETGDADLLVGFAALGVTPTFASYQFNNLEIGLLAEELTLQLPSDEATICYAIGVFGSVDDTDYHLELQSIFTPVETPYATIEPTTELVEPTEPATPIHFCPGNVGNTALDGQVQSGNIQYEDQSFFFQFSSPSGKFAIDYTGQIRVYVLDTSSGLPSSNNYLAKSTRNEGSFAVSGSPGCYNIAVESQTFNVDFTLKIVEGGSAASLAQATSTIARDVSIGVLVPLGVIAACGSFIYHSRTQARKKRFQRMEEDVVIERPRQTTTQYKEPAGPTQEISDVSEDFEQPRQQL